MGQNFIPSRDDESNIIRNDRKEVIGVITEHKDTEIKFFRKGGKVLRDKTYKPHHRIYDKNIFFLMRKQAAAILAAHPEAPVDSLTRGGWSNLERQRLNALEDLGIHITKSGFVVINTFRDNKIVSTPFPDIDKAIRSLKHTIDGYMEADAGELYKMQEVYCQLNDIEIILREQMIRSCKGSELSAEKAQDALRKLQGCRNNYKKEVARQLEAIAEGKDSRGRDNPGAARARVQAGKSNNQKRKKQIHNNCIRAAKRMQALLLEKSEMRLRLVMACYALDDLLDPSIKTISDNDVGKVKHLLQSAWAYPYKETAQRAMAEIHNTGYTNPRMGIAGARRALTPSHL